MHATLTPPAPNLPAKLPAVQPAVQTAARPRHPTGQASACTTEGATAGAAGSAAPLQRPDPYRAAHKALRHALMGQLQWLGTLDAQDAAQVTAVLRELRNLLDRLATHQRLETEFLHPALDARQPGLTSGATQDHLDDLSRSAALRTLADQAAAEPHALPRTALLGRLYREFAAFAAQQLHHMAHEDERLAPMFLALFDDAQLQALMQRAQATVPRWERLALLLLMADALNPQELAAALLGLRGGSAPEAWMALVMAAQGRTGAARWPAVQQCLRAAGAL